MRIRDWDRNLKIRLLGETIVNISFWMYFPFMAIYFSDAFGKDKAGLLLFSSQLFSVVATLLGGYFADRVGRKRMMVISSFSQGGSLLLFALANSPWVSSPAIAFLAFSLVGVFGALYWPASQAMVADIVPEKDRNSVFAVFYTTMNISVVFGPIIGSVLYANYLYELLLVTAVSNFFLGTILMKLLKETAPLDQRLAEKTIGSKWHQFLLNQLQSYSIIFRDRILLLFIVGGILVSQTFLQLDLLIPVYTKDVIDNPIHFTIQGWSITVTGELAFGVLIAENGLLVALCTIAVAKWMSHYSNRSLFIGSSVVYGIAILLFSWASGFWGLVFAMAVFTFAELMTVGVYQTFISKIAPDKMRAQYFAAANLRFAVGRMIAPFSLTLTVWVDYGWTFVILCFLALFSAFIYYMMFQKIDKGIVSKTAVQG